MSKALTITPISIKSFGTHKITISVKRSTGGSNAGLEFKAQPYRQRAFLFMTEQAVIAETRAAERTIKLLPVENLIPAFAAFYSSIDQLKHQTFIRSRD